MNIGLFETLIYEEESTTLDFKKQQYRFSKESEDVKSELLKDILGFANAWRRSDAFILIGVKEVRGGRGEVVGLEHSEHLDDHVLQQFVNNRTNRPIRFHYEAFEFEGKQVGIIKIEQQDRPIYLKRDYGKLSKETVYVRRGSSTDPTKPASIDEIAKMGGVSHEPSCDLVVELADPEKEESLGARIDWEAENCSVPEQSEIPNFRPPEPGDTFGLGASFVSSINSFDVNTSYYRELANFEFMHRLFRPIRFMIKNKGEVAARNVQVDFKVRGDFEVAIVDDSDLPSRPHKKQNPFLMHGPQALPTINSKIPGSVTIENSGVEVDCGDLQPGRKVWSEIVYFGSRSSQVIKLKGTIFADNLPKPKEIEIAIDMTVVETTLSITELLSL